MAGKPSSGSNLIPRNKMRNLRDNRTNFQWSRVVRNCSLIALAGPTLDIVLTGEFNVRRLLLTFSTGIIFSNLIGLTATALALWALPSTKRGNNVRTYATFGLILLVAGVLGDFVCTSLFYYLGLFKGVSFWKLYTASLRYSLFVTFVFGGGVTAFEALRERLAVASSDLQRQQLERARAEKLATETQLSSLESRVHPHFLFNALNSISSLIREDPALAEELVGRMAALLRFSLYSAGLRSVPLEQELRIVKDYLEIESVRFSSRLHYIIDVPASCNGVEVPPMSVQTLVENSIKFAIAPRREGGFIHVTARPHGDSMEILVCDDGAGFEPGALQSNHGLDSLMDRLDNLYGSRATLDFRRSPSGMTVAIIVPAPVREPVA